GEFKSPISPVVLCHGLFGYSEKQIATLQLQYWRGIKDVLLHRGCEVYSTGVGSISSVKERAVNLHKFLEQNFRVSLIINLVAHSMGGLDCRYLISHIPNRSYKILSVSTIATPHRGSSFMDWVRDKVGVGHLSQYIRRETEDVVPFDALAFTNLTRDYCRAFNSITHDDPEVYYSSYAASANMGILSRLAFPFHIVRKSEGENDGFVSVESAKWGI
ncbi:Alpha/Beta hydrolase protein, partial [Globomyces pollinis-pini]